MAEKIAARYFQKNRWKKDKESKGTATIRCHKAGTNESRYCKLILTEGDSVISTAVAGLLQK